MSNRRLALLFSVLSLMACAAEPSNGGSTLRFASSDELLAWLAEKVPDHPGTQVVRGADGSIQNIRFDDAAARDGLFEEFKPYTAVEVAGQAYNVDGTPLTSGSTEVRAAALSDDSTFCSNGLCIEGSSTNTHFSLFGVGYNQVGAATSITSGGTKSFYCPPIVGSFGSVQCFLPGFKLTYDTDYVGLCKGGQNLSGLSCVKISGTEHVGVEISYFTTVTGSPTVILTEPLLLTNATSVGKSYTSLGTQFLACPYTPTFECAVSGVCATHHADTPTASVTGMTNSGTTTCR
jgi:hypothetical protein